MSVLSIVGGSQTYSSASGGKVMSFNNISSTFQVVAQSNVNRQKITFHNPGTNNILVAPSVIANLTTGALTTFAPSVASPGGCFLVYGNGGTLVIEGECSTGWQAACVSGASQPLTVMDSNIA